MTEMMRHIRNLFLVFFLFPGFMLMGQPESPVLRCLSVNFDGAVSISWTTASPIPGFERYEIYSSTSAAGPFSFLQQVTNESTTSYNDASADANNQVHYYYVITFAGGVSSESSDTLGTMLLELDEISPERVRLSWNAPHTPLPPGSPATYGIYREYPPGTWTLVTNTPAREYTDQFYFCNENLDIVNYQVRLENNSGCASESNITGDILYSINPSIPIMDSVSITPDGRIVIGWRENPEPDILGYTIYRVLPGSNDSIDFVTGKDNTIYYFDTGDPCSETYSFAISALDSCGNKSPGTYENPHRTLLLDQISYDPCERKNTITWSEYINFNPPLSHYDLFVSVNGGPFAILDNITYNLTSYEHNGVQSNTTYEYFVRAVSSDGKSSSSCERSVTTYDSPEPSFLYLSNVTVTQDENVEVSFYVDTSVFVDTYRIFRSNNTSGPFEEIGTVAPSVDEVLEFTDTDVDVNAGSYYYKVTVVDSCLNESEIANQSRSIFLTVNANADRTNDLSWNDYSFWEGGVESYDVYRLTDGNIDAVFSTDETTFTDDVSVLSGLNARISYYVEAYEGTGNPYGFRETSRSNEAAAMQEAVLHIPNAFRPNGINNTFKPVTSFIDGDGYYFAVYNRWGQQVFETTNPETAWDGTENGNPATQGVYVYLVRYRLSSGSLEKITGNVLVLY